MPTFIKRLSGLPDRRVALLVVLPGLVGIAGMLLNGWHSEKVGERRWHTAVPLMSPDLLSVAAYLQRQFPLAMSLFDRDGGLVPRSPCFLVDADYDPV